MQRSSQPPKIEPPAIAENGWKFHEKCRCTGIIKYKYRHPEKKGLELEWWPRYYQFRVTVNERMTKVAPTPITKLDEELKLL